MARHVQKRVEPSRGMYAYDVAVIRRSLAEFAKAHSPFPRATTLFRASSPDFFLILPLYLRTARTESSGFMVEVCTLGVLMLILAVVHLSGFQRRA